MAKSEKLHGVNTERLLFARTHYGLTPEDVHSKTKIKVDSIRNFEAGTLNPSYAELSTLAKVYKRPLLYFFFVEPPQPDALQGAFRSIEQELGLSFDLQGRLMLEKANEYRMNLAELFTGTDHPVFHQLLEEFQVRNETQLLAFLREKLNLSLDAQKNKFSRSDALLEYIREQLYSIGIYVFKDSFKADAVSGLCLFDNNFPIILLNNKTTFTRQLFTVFHEIFHLWRKEVDIYIPKSNEEKACDRFASEFLIPSDDFTKQINRAGDCENQSIIETLASSYKVSPEAIAYKLRALDRISTEFYQSIRHDGIRKMNTTSSGGNFYYTRMSYLGKPYLKQVFTKYYDGKISTAAVGKYTGLKATHVAKLSSNMFGGAY